MGDFQYYEDLPRGFHASLEQLTAVHPQTDIPRGQRLGYYDLTPAPTEIAPVARSCPYVRTSVFFIDFMDKKDLKKTKPRSGLVFFYPKI